MTMLWRAWLAIVGLCLATFVAMSAHAALTAIARHPAHVVADVPDAAPRGYEADDHFPGATLLYETEQTTPDKAAPAAGVTGTTDLPDLPIPADARLEEDAAASGPIGIVPARPFSLGRASVVDRGRAQECLTAAIYYEAASEPDAGQQAVAQVILNRVRHPAFPATVCGVVYQGSERSGCQFSFACDGSMRRVPARAAWGRASRVAAAALAGYVFKPIGLATHYHTYAVTPAWNRSLVMTDVVGAHFFHRWKGYWGTAGAFHQPYAGVEPLPGPHTPLPMIEPTPLVLAAAVPPAAAPPYAAPPYAVPTAPPRPAAPASTTPAATIRPAYADSGLPIVSRRPAATIKAPAADDSQILDKWKDAGQPLR